MTTLFPFSFESKWDFDIIRDYSAGRSGASACHSAPKRRPGFKSNGVDRQVDFSPRYHQISMHKEATNGTKRCETSPHSRQPSNRSYTLRLESNDLYKQRLLEVIKRRRRMSEQPMKDFKVNVHCSSKDDDRVQLAQDWLSRVDHPYKDPKPHDFRPVCSCIISDTTLIVSCSQGRLTYSKLWGDNKLAT